MFKPFGFLSKFIATSLLTLFILFWSAFGFANQNSQQSESNFFNSTVTSHLKQENKANALKTFLQFFEIEEENEDENKFSSFSIDQEWNYSTLQLQKRGDKLQNNPSDFLIEIHCPYYILYCHLKPDLI